MANLIQTLKKDSDVIFPRTKIEAISDASGNGLENILNTKVDKNTQAQKTSDMTSEIGIDTNGKLWVNSSSSVWGNISGTLNNQIDLITALNNKTDKMAFSDTLPTTAVVNTIYSLGTQSTITTALPAGAIVGDIISIIWYNGPTAATVTITGTILPFSYVPTASYESEICAQWNGTAWSLIASEQAVV